MKVLIILSLIEVFLCILKLIYDGVTAEPPWEISSGLTMIIMLLIAMAGMGVFV